MLTPKCFAQAHDSKKMTISYVIYPQIERYIDLINDVYSELGYTVSMLPTPATRGLVLLNEGEVDADVVRVKLTVENYANAILVEPALKIAKLTLICVKGVLCEANILHKKNTVILTTEGMLPYLAALNAKVRIEKVPAITSIIEMLKIHRVSYAVLVTDELMSFSDHFNQVELQEMSVYHVIHKKHAALLPLVQQKLIEKLPAFNASQVNKERQ